MTLTTESARIKRFEEADKRRGVEHACALDFLVYGDEGPRGPHAPRCVHALAGGAPCSRDYDPVPYPEATPHDPRLYAADDETPASGIAALYGLPGGEAHAWQLAGWNLCRT